MQAGGRGFEPHILHKGTRMTRARFFDRMESESRHKEKTHEQARCIDIHCDDKREREASKGARRMPWLPEAMKDAAGRESLRGGANGR